MFWRKNLRQADKLILDADVPQKDEPAVINVKIDAKEQLYSAYSYSGDNLNPEFCDYVFDRAKSAPLKEELTVRIHTADALDLAETKQAIQNHYRAVYRETKKEVKRIAVISLIMTLLGILALTALILINRFTDNLYLTSIVEIAAWVFIWEAVDFFFLQRPVVRGKCILIQRIFLANVEIVSAGD